MIRLDSSVSMLSGIGAKTKKILESIKIETCKDLIFYFPFRYDDFSVISAIKDVQPGMTVTVQGVVQLLQNRRSPMKKKVLTEGLIEDETGSIKVVWFNQPFLIKNISIGDRISLSGKVNDHFYDLQLLSPSYEKIESGKEGLHTARLVPVYPLTSGISLKQFRALIRMALDHCLGQIDDWLPEELLQQEDLISLQKALQDIHFPLDDDAFVRARRRLQFDELLTLQLVSISLKKNLLRSPGVSIPFDKDITTRFIDSLPFELTKKQKKVSWELLKNMEEGHPMCRLLEGDVGSGKTLCAAMAILNVVNAHHQAVVLAPTEILVRQHFDTLSKLFVDFQIRVALITSSTHLDSGDSEAGKKEVQEGVRTGVVQVVVGTHALLEKGIIFNDLAFVVIDEQHRFGVRQRQLIHEKREDECMPHLLSMTATPIPRSLALALYGDLDISIIDEKPVGRKKITTKIVPPRFREWTYGFISKQIQKGRQTFIICPLIDPSDTLGARSVRMEYERLKKDIFPDLKIGMLHGRMRQQEKEKVMREMLSGDIQILVCTSIVEVGIDIPNATTMVIEGAERFGLAQLHQFRGRVGRSDHESYCFLFQTDEQKEERVRLKALVESEDGFALAEKDLALRGSGEMYGRRQSGLPCLKIATLDDLTLIQKARECALYYMEHIDTQPKMIERINEFEKAVHLE